MAIVFASLLAVAAAQLPHAFRGYNPAFVPAVRAGRFHMANMNLDFLREKSAAAEEEKVYEMGQVNHVETSLLKDAFVKNMTNGELYVKTFEMDNAVSMAFHFSEFQLAEGDALFIVGPNKNLGPFTHENRWRAGDFQTAHVEGNTVQVHYFHSHNAEAAKINLDVVTTGFRLFGEQTKRAQSCNINVECINEENTCDSSCDVRDRWCSIQCTYNDQDSSKGQWADASWEKESRAVVAVGRNYASRYCSGTFINNKDHAPYVLTAYHCGPSRSDIVLLKFQHPDCDGSNDNTGATSFVLGDLTTLTRNSGVDNELISVGEAIPADWNIYLAGYDTTAVHTGQAVGIHHPAAANMKISHTSNPLVYGSWGWSSQLNHWKVEAWTEATTEGGSSGSGLFDQDSHRLLGQLHGGSASCPAYNGYDVYGGLFASWDIGMSDYLGEPFMDGAEY